MPVKQSCIQCGVNLQTYPSRLKKNRGKFCSKACFDSFRRGKPMPKRKAKEVVCATCGKSFFAVPAQLRKGRGKYCSQDCYWKLKKGKPSPKWNRTKKTCETCGKIFYVNQFRHLKCPSKCCSYRCSILRLYTSGTYPKQTHTAPELQLKEELIKRGYVEGVDFIHQYKFYDKFLLDFVFLKEKVIVECDGDFWHAIPSKYANKPLRPAQVRTARMDKSKNAYIAKVDNGSWLLLRFWESEIKKNVKSCVDKIEAVLKERVKV